VALLILNDFSTVKNGTQGDVGHMGHCMCENIALEDLLPL
jgi:hypothetical protein